MGGLLEASTAAPQWWVPLLLAAPVLVGSALWLSRSLASYEQPLRRSLIVQTVSAG